MFCEVEPDMDYYINNFEYRPNLGAMSTTSSPYSLSSMDSPESSQMSTSPVLSPDTLHNLMILSSDEQLAQNIATLSTCRQGVPFLEVVEQPADKFRFRYKSEMMGAHGSILGRSSVRTRRKTYPSVKLHNFSGKALVRCSLFTAEADESLRSPHTHRLVVREGNEEVDDPHGQEVDSSSAFTATFQGMGIIHTAKKNVAEELVVKKGKRLLEHLKTKNINIKHLSKADEAKIKAEAEKQAKKMNLNVVSLCFECMVMTSSGVYVSLCAPVYSLPISNMKSALTGELKICRIDQYSSSCLGNEEVFLLVEKVGRKNIQVRFFEIDADEVEVWEAYGKFTELDVHHQFAIVLRTPPYRFVDIEDPVEVFLELYRPSDGDRSNPISFKYKPSEKTLVMGRKRPRRNSCDSTSGPLRRADPMLASADNESFPSASALLQGIEAFNSEEFDKFYRNLEASDHAGADPGPFLFEDMNLTCDGPRVKTRSAIVYPEGATDGDKLLIRVTHRVKELASVNRPINLIRDLFYEKTEDGDSALHLAVVHSEKSYLNTLLNALCRGSLADVLDIANNKDETSLHLAVLTDQSNVVESLLAGGADCRRVANNGDSALHLAIKHRHQRCLAALLDNRPTDSAMRDARNEQGWTALHLAVLHDNLPGLRHLLRAGCDTSRTDRAGGRTPLHVACGEERREAAIALIGAGAEVDAKDSAGNTPLHAAVAAGAVPIVLALLEAQADPLAANFSVKDSDDVKTEVQTPFDLAASKPEILALIISSINAEPSLHVEVKMEPEEVEPSPICGDYLDKATQAKLCTILDSNGGWVDLAALLDLDFLVAGIRNSSSPTKMLINYADVQGTLSVEKIRETLTSLNQSEAVEAIDLMLAKLLADRIDT